MMLDYLQTKFIGRNLINYETIDSTQKEAWRLVNRKLKNGSLIVADLQTDGVGTHGRKWYTDKEGNIAFSIVMYPHCDIEKLRNLTLDIARIIVEAFENLYGITLHVKVPNDIVFNGKKLGGILTETRILGSEVNELVIGVGINLNQERFIQDIENTATSIRKEFGIYTDRNKIISEICNLFEVYFEKSLEISFAI